MDMDEHGRLKIALEALGLPYTTNMLDQFRIMVECMQIFVEREAVRNGLWKQYDVEDATLHIKSKAARFVQNPTLEDDGLDLINYTVFALRHMRGAV